MVRKRLYSDPRDAVGTQSNLVRRRRQRQRGNAILINDYLNNGDRCHTPPGDIYLIPPIDFLGNFIH